MAAAPTAVRAGALVDRVRAGLARAPFLPIAGVLIAVCVYQAGDEGGFKGTTFLPATLLVLALLVMSLVALPRPEVSRATLAAVALLGSYAAYSYLSMAWAGEGGIAWDGANRTVLYALVFALMALRPLRGSSAAVVLGAYGLGVAGVGLVELLRAAASSNAVAYFHEGRLSEPVGYANANVALWFTAFWPCLVLAARRQVHPALRGLFLGSAGLLAALAVLGQSRSWLAALPLMVVIVIVAVPGRARTIVALGLVGTATLTILSRLNDSYTGFGRGNTPPTEFFAPSAHAALYAALVLALVGMAWGVGDRLLRPSAQTARRVSAAVFVAFALACVGGFILFVHTQGSPTSVASRVWKEFKKGGSEPHFQGSRLGLSAGSYRYDYFRVALQNFKDRPLFGVGVDNYGRQYLTRGRTGETPNYPHSIELRVLSMTGLVGVGLFGGAVLAALIAATTAIRRAPGLEGVAAGTGVVVFAYFFLHGSLDWIWEFPALGCAAFAGLGIAAALAPGGRRVRLPWGAPAAVAAGLAAVLVVIGVTLPWLAERDLRSAQRQAATDPTAALANLDRAADLNRLSALPATTAAVIEIRRDRLGVARQRLQAALQRDPGNPFAYLQLAAIASAQDRTIDALRLVAKARALSPDDRVTQQVQLALLRGRYVSPGRVNQLVLGDIDRRIGPK